MDKNEQPKDPKYSIRETCFDVNSYLTAYINWVEEKKEVKPPRANPQNNQDFPSKSPVI